MIEEVLRHHLESARRGRVTQVAQRAVTDTSQGDDVGMLGVECRFHDPGAAPHRPALTAATARSTPTGAWVTQAAASVLVVLVDPATGTPERTASGAFRKRSRSETYPTYEAADAATARSSTSAPPPGPSSGGRRDRSRSARSRGCGSPRRGTPLRWASSKRAPRPTAMQCCGDTCCRCSRRGRSAPSPGPRPPRSRRG